MINHNKNTIRDDLQNMFSKAFFENDLDTLKIAYKTLRNFERENTKDKCLKLCDIGNFVEGLTVGTDIITEPFFKSFIYCGNEIPNIICNISMVENAILNLFSNAYLYGKGRLVTVKTIDRTNFIDICVTSGGAFNFKHNMCSGLDFIRKVCDFHKGHFLIESNSLYSNAHILLPKEFDYANQKEPLKITDDIILDRLSPLYVELFGME